MAHTGIAVSVRELRNQTKQVIERIETGTTVYLTKNGNRIATISPVNSPTWADRVRDVLGDDVPYDSGLAELLATDQAETDRLDDIAPSSSQRL